MLSKTEVIRKCLYLNKDKTHERTITFLNKPIILNWKLRKGYCSNCPKNIYDKTCKYTQLHHWLYVPIMPWACTEEFCSRCHLDISLKLGQRKSIPSNRECKKCGLIQYKKPCLNWRYLNEKWYCNGCARSHFRNLTRAISRIVRRDFLYIG